MTEEKLNDNMIEETGDRKNRRRLDPPDARRWIRFFSVASILLVVLLVVAVMMAFNHYKIYPGRIERDTISSPGRGADYIVLSWDEVHNADVYKVWYRENEPAEAKEEADASEPDDEQIKGKNEVIIDDSWTELETDVPEITVRDLNEDTSYAFIVRADSKTKEGISTEPRRFRTKKLQTIQVSKTVTKFTCSEPFRLNVVAETGLMYKSSDPDVAVIDPATQEIKITGEGDAEITITAKASSEFESARKTVALKVIDTTPVSAGGAAAHIIYHLDADNCEVVKRVSGAGGAVIPQGLAYSGDKYIISYGMGSPNRIISFDVDGDGKDVSVPKVSLGHPNGFTYADENGICYVAKGYTSKVFTYEPTSDSYGSVGLSYGCSGIGYDRKEKLLYTCSQTAMVAYDISGGYSVKYKCGVVKHSGKVYTQDCGGHAGLLFRCLSGSSKHGINYIDIYHMPTGRYLGTISCDLSEVESCIVDKDGFLEILANNSSNVDYIWKTDLNVDTLGEGL